MVQVCQGGASLRGTIQAVSLPGSRLLNVSRSERDAVSYYSRGRDISWCSGAVDLSVYSTLLYSTYSYSC